MIFKTEKNSEEKLIRACCKRKISAQKALYERYAEYMLAVCLRYVPEQQQAEDLMIQAFAKMFEKIEQFKFEGSFEGWLRRIVINECLMHLRKRQFFMDSLENAEREILSSGENTHLETQDLLQMVGQLPAGYRMVFNLYAIEGYSHKEIAEQLNISEGTSKSQLSKARQLLQKQLKNQELLQKPNTFRSQALTL